MEPQYRRSENLEEISQEEILVIPDMALMLDSIEDEIIELLYSLGLEITPEKAKTIAIWHNKRAEQQSNDVGVERLRKVISMFASLEKPIKFWALMYAADIVEVMRGVKMVDKAKELGYTKQNFDKEIKKWIKDLQLPNPHWMHSQKKFHTSSRAMAASHKNRQSLVTRFQASGQRNDSSKTSDS